MKTCVHKKAYKIRIYPNKTQEALIVKTIGCCRFVYNYALGEQKKLEDRYFLVNEMVQQGYFDSNQYKTDFFRVNNAKNWLPELKSNHPFLKEVDSVALQASIEDLGDAYGGYYRKTKGHPHFKSRKFPKNSYTTKRVSNNIKIVDKRHIVLPKLGVVKARISKNIPSEIKRATVSRTPSGKYFVSILTDSIITPLPKSSKKIGLDLGIKDFAISSDGTTYKNIAPYKSMEQDIIRLQRLVSRKKLGSNRYKKACAKLAKLHEHIANKRHDYLHKLSTKLIRENQVIVLEDLSVKDMMQGEELYNAGKNITDVSWATFRTMLAYKAKWYGRELIIAPKYFASTQICSHCQTKNPHAKPLWVRKWACKSCGTSHDRDINAAKNLLSLAI